MEYERCCTMQGHSPATAKEYYTKVDRYLFLKYIAVYIYIVIQCII